MIRKGIITTKDGFRILGGPGSGNFDHAGIPGQQGGSAPSGGSGGQSQKMKDFVTAKLKSEAKPAVPSGGSVSPGKIADVYKKLDPGTGYVRIADLKSALGNPKGIDKTLFKLRDEGKIKLDAGDAPVSESIIDENGFHFQTIVIYDTKALK